MTAQVPDVVAQQALAIMRSNDIVVLVCREEGTTVVGKGEDLLKEIVATMTTQRAGLAYLHVENEDAAAYLIALYKTSHRTVH